LFRELQRAVDPPVDQLSIRQPLPHPRPARRLERELRIQLPGGTAELDRLLHGRAERFAVEPERVRMSDLLPELDLLLRIGFELNDAVKQREALVDLVAADGEVCRSSRPLGGALTESFHLLVSAGPGKID